MATIASDLLQRHIETLVDDAASWETLIADDIVWELATRLRSAIQRGSLGEKRSSATLPGSEERWTISGFSTSDPSL